jgi:hypothetical protein
MGGNYSRGKGRRHEYMVRDELRKAGFEADRVPLSGASQGYKGDIRAKRDGQEYIFEAKCRAKGFEAVYRLFALHNQDGVVRVALGEDQVEGRQTLLVMARSADLAIQGSGHYKKAAEIPLDQRLEKRLLGFQKWLQGAHILVIRGDRMHNLYLRYS